MRNRLCLKIILFIFILLINFKNTLPANTANYNPFVSEIMSRPYPRLMGNQWCVSPSGEFVGDNHYELMYFVVNHLDYIALNRVGGGMNDLFLDFHQSTQDPAKGLLKTRNDIYNNAAQVGRRVYVLAYQNMSDVWYYQSIQSFPNENFWFKPERHNVGTWDYFEYYNYWLYDQNNQIVTYPWGNYTNAQRRFWNPGIPEAREYWAQHAKGIVDKGFDGIFSDNWLRSGFNSQDIINVQAGWNETGRRFKQLAPDKILIGNSPPYPIFDSRDICMLEDRINTDQEGDESVQAYLNYSDGAKALNQVCQDTFFDESKGDFVKFRIPMVLLTDNIFGISTSTKQGNKLISSYGQYLVKLGKVGYPEGSRYRADGILQRNFTNGKVLMNDTQSTKTIYLPPSTYKDIDGNEIRTVVLEPFCGMVLKKID